MFSRVSVCLSEKDSVISKRKAKAVFTGKISDKERHPIPIFLFSSAKDRLGIEIWATLYISLVHNKEDREAFHRVVSHFCSKQMYLWSESSTQIEHLNSETDSNWLKGTSLSIPNNASDLVHMTWTWPVTASSGHRQVQRRASRMTPKHERCLRISTK